MEDNSYHFIEALRSDSFLPVNKKVLAKLGAVKTLMISNYVDKYIYFTQNEMDWNGAFYLTHAKIAEQLGEKEYTIQRIKKELIKDGYISTEMKGARAKEWITLHFDKLNLLIANQTPTKLKVLGLKETEGLIGLKETEGLYKDNKDKDNRLFVSSSPPPDKKESDKIVPGDFDKFWEMYPSKRRGSKGPAYNAWLKLCRAPNGSRPDWQRIRAAIIKQKKSERWVNQINYIPLASTWLNKSRWLDDPRDLTLIKDYNSDSTKQDKERDELYLEQERRRKTKELEEAMRHE
jgi:hypothetical protein